MPKDNGPAFPVESRVDRGLTKREYYAAAALTGLCASVGANCSDDGLAKSAFRIADAMIAAVDSEQANGP